MLFRSVAGDPHSFTTLGHFSRSSCTRVLSAHKSLCTLLLVFFSLARIASGAETATPKNVLVLFSTFTSHNSDLLSDIEPAVRAHFNAFASNNSKLLSDIEPALRGRVPGQITFYEAYLEHSRVAEKSYRESQAETFRNTYAGVKFSLVIVSHDEALQFALQYRDKIFPGVPIVFVEVSTGELEGQTIRPGVTGLTVPVGLRETIDLALRLQPDTEAIAVIAAKTEDYWLGVAHSELLRHQDKVKEIDLIGPASGELLEKVAALPPHAVVLFQLAPQVTQQPELGTWEFLAAVAKRVPTYSPWPSLCLGYGCIGGAYPDARKQHLWTADLAGRVLSGERPENIPIAHNSDLQVTVDWRALRRWNLPDSALPAGSVIINRVPSFWERDPKYIIAAVLVILAQSLLIAGLLWQRARKQKAEAVMSESEKRFRVMADTTPSLIWMADQNGKITYLNSKSVEFTGDSRTGFGNSWSEYIHPDDLDSVLSANAGALAKRVSFSKEYRLRRYDGIYRWMFDVASPRVNGDGSFAGFIGSAIDITDQKVAQDALEKVSGRLIEAQERERSRIARDLHDDICQRLALLSMELEQANRTLNEAPAITNQRLEEIQRHCSEITGDVQALSHQLHSSKLDYLGITAAIRSFCKEFARQHGASVEFAEEGLPTHLPKDVSLCLFRVTQEALHNAVKYSGTNQYTVDLKSDSDKVELGVSDTGVGFDVEAARRNGGLGLLSMQERVHLVHGELFIESSPGKGSRIVAKVPVTVKADAETGGNQGTRIAGVA